MFKRSLRTIFYLGLKEFCGVFRDPLLAALIVYSFTLSIWISANAKPDHLYKAAIAVADDDRSQLSRRIRDAFLMPMFAKVRFVTSQEADSLMDQGHITFAVEFPPDFRKDLAAGKKTAIQLNADATRMSQAFTGAGYIRQIIMDEIDSFTGQKGSPAAELVLRNRFNPNLTNVYFASVVQLISNISLLAVILTGAALIRERERGTLEHLLVMPVDPPEIILSKIWSMGTLVFTAAFLSHIFIIGMVLKVPMTGSRLLFAAGMIFYLFAVTSIGIFLACIAGNMPRLGILLILVLMPMEMLSGGITPIESMPPLLQKVVQIFPTTRFIAFCQGVLYRGAGLEVVWPEMLALLCIGGILFGGALFIFRRSVT
ncbi:MAG: ABC transporter permease [Lentisphaeria bacterium]|nr:ABC transporter permease [Lentisphaeria bacterium]